MTDCCVDNYSCRLVALLSVAVCVCVFLDLLPSELKQL